MHPGGDHLAAESLRAEPLALGCPARFSNCRDTFMRSECRAFLRGSTNQISVQRKAW